MIAIKSFPCPLYWNRHPLGLAHSVLRKTEKNAHSYVWLFFTTTTTTPRSLSFLLKKNIAKKQNHRNRRRKKNKKKYETIESFDCQCFPPKKPHRFLSCFAQGIELCHMLPPIFPQIFFGAETKRTTQTCKAYPMRCAPKTQKTRGPFISSISGSPKTTKQAFQNRQPLRFSPKTLAHKL